MPTTRVEQSFYPNGKLESEVTFVGALPNGTRRWHPNGVLAEELAVNNGSMDGVSKQWNDKGELLGSFEMRNGTGVWCRWNSDGTLDSEASYVHGYLTGRIRVWTSDGGLFSESFWLRGRKVSRKKYLEACKADPSLPNYENEPKVVSWETKMKRLATKKQRPTTEPPAVVASPNRLLEKFLTDPTRREARGWLMEAAGSEARNLGEIPSWKESLALVEEAYAESVAELFVVKVTDYGEGLQNTGTLLARLPVEGRKRKKALAWCNEQNDFQGFDPESDEGQEWVVVQLD